IGSKRHRIVGMTQHESWKKLKLVEIHQALNSDPIRRKVWPKLLCINILWLSLQTQFCSLPLYPEEPCVVLQKNPALHYYQGYHDILVTFLLVVGEHGFPSLSWSHYPHSPTRDFMDPTMDSTKHTDAAYFPPSWLGVSNQQPFGYWAEVGTIFALSWLITWYGHVLSEFHHVLRLYDFFLASHPLMAVYFAAVIVLHREKEVKQTECDMSMVYHLQIPQDLPYEKLITQAHCLFTLYLPSLLASCSAVPQEVSGSGSPCITYHNLYLCGVGTVLQLNLVL
uniref:Zgc:63863 n=1 Tax=Hucho hucho TaxID=62062 RepID=A0A4W5MWS7_9TELE